MIKPTEFIVGKSCPTNSIVQQNNYDPFYKDIQSHESLNMVSIETKIIIIILLKNIIGRDFKKKIANKWR
jgi:hypothetical protein